MGCRLMQKSMTLNDLQRPKRIGNENVIRAEHNVLLMLVQLIYLYVFTARRNASAVLAVESPSDVFFVTKQKDLLLMF